MEKYTTKNADALDGNINQLAQAIKEGTNIEFIGPKREVASGIDQETRNLCVRMNQDAGLMQQLKANNSRLAAIIEAAAVNEAEVATRHPESVAAQAVANGDVSYGGVVVVAPAVASVAPVAPLVLLADPEEDAAEVIAVPAVAVPLATAPVVINMEDVGVVPPPVEEAPHTGAEIMIVQRIKRIVPVEGNIEGFDGKNDDYNIIQERTKVEVSSSTNKSESNDSEVILENSKQEEARQEEEAKVVASIKEAAEASIAEVVEMQNAVKQEEEMIGAIYNPIHDITQMSCNIISHRMFASAAVAAGDEDVKVLDKSLCIAGTYGTNTRKGFAGYKGHASGGTIGFDIGADNYKDFVGIAYTKLDSKFKSNGNRSNTNIDSHIVTLYGQKELPKNFMIQAMFAYNHNIVKSKINRLGTIATGKYKHNNYNFETVLSYTHLMNGDITLTPNIGIRYGHSKDDIKKVM